MILCLYASEHCSYALYEFQAHAAIVVWAFPEAGMIIVEVHSAILVNAPVPFAPSCIKHIVEPERQDVLCKTFVDFTA